MTQHDSIFAHVKMDLDSEGGKLDFLVNSFEGYDKRNDHLKKKFGLGIIEMEGRIMAFKQELDGKLHRIEDYKSNLAKTQKKIQKYKDLCADLRFDPARDPRILDLRQKATELGAQIQAESAHKISEIDRVADALSNQKAFAKEISD